MEFLRTEKPFKLLLYAIVILISFPFISCENHSAKTSYHEANQKWNHTIGERINGPANIRDTINGQVLFSLYDTTLVTCTESENGWYVIGLVMDIQNDEFGIDTLRKGRKIFVDGVEVGEILNDMEVSSISSGDKQSWAQLVGYTYEKNIFSASIIENSLENYMKHVSRGRSLDEMQNFISDFQLEKDDQLAPFATYSNYENWIEDPSPGYRIQLVFSENKLIGIVHTRPLTLANSSNQELDRGYHILFFDDTPNKIQSNYIAQFNQFLQGVD